MTGRVVTGRLQNGDELSTGARDGMIALRAREGSNGLVGLKCMSWLLAVSSALGRSITEVAGVVRFRAGTCGGDL